MLFVLVSVVVVMAAESGAGIQVGPGLAFMLALLAVTVVLGVVLAVFLIADVFRNPAVPRDQQAAWAAILALGGFPVFPYYWYRYIWRT